MSKKSFDLSQDSTDENPVVEYSTPISPSENVEEKQKKADDITVTISDRSPVVLLFGAGSSGKTMTLIRLTRWLRDREYQVNPIENFHESNQGYYQSLRDQFDDTVNSDYAAAQTGTVNFMLIMVRNKYGEPICQILEAPGEHYFRKDAPKAAFPTYISTILQRNNPKTWVFIVERYWETEHDRINYANKIISMQSKIGAKDRIIFACHKADLHPELIFKGIPNKRQFFTDIKNQYPGIFAKYMNKHPITRWWRPYNFDFLVFSSGEFRVIDENTVKYIQSNDKYPAVLWKSILKTVKGGWN